MRTKRFLSAIAGASCIASPAAFAADAGFYLGAGIGQSKFIDQCSSEPGITITSCSDTDTATKLFAGYQITRNWGVEASYVDFGKFTASAIVLGTPASLVVKANGFQF